MIVNPEQDAQDARICNPGNKILYCTGVEFKTSSNNNPMVNVRFTCVKDMDNADDEGADVFCNFTLIPTAKRFLANFALAVGQIDPFDTSDREALTGLFTKKAFRGTVGIRKYTHQGEEKEAADIKVFGVYDGDRPDGYSETVKEGRERHAEFVKRKKDGGGNRSNNRPTQGGYGSETTASEYGTDEDSIPF